ncbi:MAG: gamma-glutamyltransferase [Synergistaceae bacterium]|nr:gamma-glutamyltransferase [Synergistota bacterium]NLM71457.1 gamma-glutamyltransferase [Synergistaceae bacterium]
MRRYLSAALVLLLVMAAGACAAEFEVRDVYSRRGMVSSAHELASRAGVEIMERGGNAIDAAVATMLALNVVEPNASGLGGGGFSTIRFAKTGEVVELDYREIAPLSATKDMYASEASKKARESVLGGKAVGVPGIVMGVFTMLEKYGTMTFAEVAEPAIRLAEEGFEVHPMQNGIINDEYDKLAKYSPVCAFLPDGLPAEAGSILKQPELAGAFRLLAKDGPNAFYRGPIGEAVVAAVNGAGGDMSMKDLNNYSMEIRTPVKGTYRGYSIYSTPPASSGGTHIVQLLNIMENFQVSSWGHNSPTYLHHLAEAMKMVFADRQRYMADTAFVDVPLKGLASKEYARTQADKITPFEAAAEVLPGNPWRYDEAKEVAYQGHDGNKHVSTSSFSVVDAAGNIVASTNTVNFFFGSGVVVPEYGIVLNNEMDDFAQDPASVNAPEPGKRPLSSMSPTIVIDPEGRPFMTLGSAGAMRIITALSQIIMNVVDFGMTMDEAIEQPRIFNSAGGGKAGQLLVEGGISPKTATFLRFMGHDVVERDRDGYFGTAQGIMFNYSVPKASRFRINGGADSRRLGVPVGF